jgi:hypothetical protein
MKTRHKQIRDDAARLASLLKTKDYIPFHVDLPDKEHPQVKCSIYGATKSNELFVRLSNGIITFAEATPSPLLGPSMVDRIFGMDVADADAAFSLAERMWQKHRIELLAP